MEGNHNKSVLVVGAGIAGIQAALDLAELGADVHLVEETPSIGGRMPQLDKTFPTNDCSICILAPKMSECARHPSITFYTNSSLASISGEAGNFTCSIVERAKYVDPQKCVACGLCEEKCPVKVTDEFDMGLRQRKAIYRYFLQSIPSNYLIDAQHCLYLTKGACRLCEKTCPASAINFEDEDREIVLNCGAVILATGIDPYNPLAYGQYGYKRYRDVVTSIEFERMLSASGPQRGHILRPSNGKPPRSIAFVQCVGSRDLGMGNDYCSSVCCMYAIKEAIIAKEHIKGLETSIFFMDIRAFGKDFDKYYERAESQFGVKFIRARGAEISGSNGNSLRLQFTHENGKRDTQEFDLIVLSVGLEPRKGLGELADKLNIKLDRYGFCQTDPFSPLSTMRSGIFVCGATSGPKDIPESVMSASAAVASCTRLLALERQEKLSRKQFPEERDVVGDRPRVGCFICHCGINIAGVVAVGEVVEFAKGLPYVVHAEDLLYACSQDCLNTIKERIKEHNLNRVVVAACTPRTHEPLFRETLREAGLNQYLFEMANIRDQCSWAHMDEPELATEKAKDLVSMGVAKARELSPLKRLPIEINPRTLVIGGGLSGMVAALSLADAGYEVILVEKEDQLGGNLRNIYYTLEGEDSQRLLQETVERVKGEKHITVYTNAHIEEISGYVGNFKTRLSFNGNRLSAKAGDRKPNTEIEHGVVIVATGAEEHKTKEYLRGENKRVLTQRELESYLANSHLPFLDLRTVVMVQCVDSRQGDRPYCSRVCCGEAIKNAIKIKEMRPTTNVYILYRDIRTYGLRERYYGKARDQGVCFLRYDLDNKPLVEPIDREDPESRLSVTVFDPILGQKIVIEADLLVLSVPIDAPAQNEELAKLLKVPLNKEGFFLEAHLKLRPVDFANDGVFMCGLAHSPKYIDESIVQAKAAAARALTLLSKKTIESEGTICWVNPYLCSGCGVCIEVCPYSAIEMKEETTDHRQVAEINEALCKGCGACSASCRSGAIDLRGFTNKQIFEAVSSVTG